MVPVSVTCVAGFNHPDAGTVVMKVILFSLLRSYCTANVWQPSSAINRVGRVFMTPLGRPLCLAEGSSAGLHQVYALCYKQSLTR